MGRNILEYLEASAARVPDKIAVSSEEGHLTFRELSDRARSVGSFLHRGGFYRESVAVFLRKSPVAIAAMLGCVCGGCFFTVLDPEMPRLRLEKILTKLKPRLILCDESTRDLAWTLPFDGSIQDVCEAAFGEADPAALAQIRENQLDIDPVYTVFTSGSTGEPKGVMGCHRGIIDYIENLCPVLGVDENTVFGNQVPLYVDAWLKELIPTLKFGASMHLIPRKYFLFPVKLLEYLNENKVNTLCWVVSALTNLSSLGALEAVRPKYLRTIAFASEVFPTTQLKLWREALPEARLLNLYGPTEATGICCYYEVTEIPEGPLPIGKAFPNTEVFLLDENDRLPAPGQPGEICIRGSRLTLGYCGEDQGGFCLNPLQPLFPERIYRTGDLGKYNHRGELLFLGRRDSQIKHLGHRIELGEIEAGACTCPGVTEAACIYNAEEKRLTLFYTGSTPAEALQVFLKERLPRYMLPHRLRPLTAIPRTPNGKRSQTALMQLDA